MFHEIEHSQMEFLMGPWDMQITKCELFIGNCLVSITNLLQIAQNEIDHLSCLYRVWGTIPYISWTCKIILVYIWVCKIFQNFYMCLYLTNRTYLLVSGTLHTCISVNMSITSTSCQLKRYMYHEFYNSNWIWK